jgi:GNAT superfamily N-acetyltransferase
LQQEADRQVFVDLSQEYFQWMDREIIRLCGFSIPTIVNMALGDYVAYTAKIGAGINPAEGGIYFLRDAGRNAVAMGGLRRLPSGSAEIVRIYTRPQCRGHGYGATMVENLIFEARRLGYPELYLDTGVFMTSAQKIYSAAGFSACDPYSGAEPPEALKPYWLYMRRSL